MTWLIKLYEVLNNKPISPEDELADALGDMARDIALIESNSVDWGGWLNYLMVQLEVEVQRREKLADFEGMLESLKNRLGS